MQVISTSNQYSSGLRRLGAFLIDHIALSAILSILLWQFWDWPFDYDIIRYPFHRHMWNLSFNMFSHHSLKVAIIIIYYALMESSKYQATLGKLALGIKVVDHNGQRLDFSKALLRNLSKLLSAFIFGIGYIMIIFDERKQGLHDKIADTFVVNQ